MASPLQVIETKHVDTIHDAQLDYYSRRLATCSSDRTIKIYEVTDNQNNHVADLAGHDGPVWQVAWAHPRYGTLLLSCGYDKKVIVHQEQGANQWAQLYVYSDHASSVNSIAWAPHEYGLRFACASSDGTVSVHSCSQSGEWATPQIIQGSGMGCNSVSWAPVTALGSQAADGSYIMRLVIGSCDNTARVCKFEAGVWAVEFDLKQHKDWVRDVAWAPGATVPMNTIATCSEDKCVYIWTQDEVGGAWKPTLLNAFDCAVWRVSWSVMGNILAVSTGDHKVTLWKETVDKKWIQLSSVGSGTNGGAAANAAQS
eukprot:g3028.t1